MKLRLLPKASRDKIKKFIEGVKSKGINKKGDKNLERGDLLLEEVKAEPGTPEFLGTRPRVDKRADIVEKPRTMKHYLEQEKVTTSPLDKVSAFS